MKLLNVVPNNFIGLQGSDRLKVESKVEGLKISLKVRKKNHAKFSFIRVFFSIFAHKNEPEQKHRDALSKQLRQYPRNIILCNTYDYKLFIY